MGAAARADDGEGLEVAGLQVALDKEHERSGGEGFEQDGPGFVVGGDYFRAELAGFIQLEDGVGFGGFQGVGDGLGLGHADAFDLLELAAGELGCQLGGAGGVDESAAEDGANAGSEGELEPVVDHAPPARDSRDLRMRFSGISSRMTTWPIRSGRMKRSFPDFTFLSKNIALVTSSRFSFRPEIGRPVFAIRATIRSTEF